MEADEGDCKLPVIHYTNCMELVEYSEFYFSHVKSLNSSRISAELIRLYQLLPPVHSGRWSKFGHLPFDTVVVLGTRGTPHSPKLLITFID